MTIFIVFLTRNAINKIPSIVESMSTDFFEIVEAKPSYLKSKICIDCASCGHTYRVTAEAAYRQHQRGHAKYTCKSCAGKAGWSPEMKTAASDKSSDNWKDPGYAGTIVGRAVARDIIRKSDEL